MGQRQWEKNNNESNADGFTIERRKNARIFYVIKSMIVCLDKFEFQLFFLMKIF